MSSVIKLENITRIYRVSDQDYHALKGVNLHIDYGDMISIMGASGAGKSTLMNIIGLLDRPSGGSYFLDAMEVAKLNDDERSKIRNLKIGFVFQSFFLLPRLSVAQNVALPLLYRGVKGKDAEKKALEELEKVSIAHLSQNKPMQLSGGQQQRVAIARALVGKPAVILADEPTGALDSKTGIEVMHLFKRLNQQEKVTIIIVTHDPSVASECHRTIHIADGLVHETDV